MEKYILFEYTSTRYNLSWFNQTLRKLNRKVQRLYNVQKCTKSDLNRTKYRHARKIYKQSLNKSYWEYINVLLDASIF